MIIKSEFWACKSEGHSVQLIMPVYMKLLYITIILLDIITLLKHLYSSFLASILEEIETTR